MPRKQALSVAIVCGIFCQTWPLGAADPGLFSQAQPVTTLLVSFRADLADNDVLAVLTRPEVQSASIRPTRVHGLWRLEPTVGTAEARSQLMTALAREGTVEFVSPAYLEADGRLAGMGAAVLFETKENTDPMAAVDAATAASGVQLVGAPEQTGSSRAYLLRVDSKNRQDMDTLARNLGADPSVVWAAPQRFSVPEEGLIYIVPKEPVEAVRYADGSRAQLPSQERWRLMCGSRPMEFDEFRTLVNKTRSATPAVAAAADEPQARVGSPFDLVFNTSGLPSGAAAAVAAVEAYLESIIFDPITVTISLSFASMSPGVLGATSSSYTSDSYTDVRAGLESGMDFDDTIQVNLPAGSTFPVRYNGNSDTVTNEGVVFVTRANYRATIGTVAGNAASMTFNNNFAWDYTPPTISSGTYCFQSVLAHEVGHALGFTSGADFRVNDSELLDLYRFQRSDGAFNYNPETLAEFTTTARMVDLNAPLTTDDVVSELISAEYRMSDGSPYQASHFRDGIGAVMDPAFGSSQTFYPEFYRTADQQMFDAIGYDVFFAVGPLFSAEADAEGSHLVKNRVISFQVPASGAGQDTAIQVKLSSLHHPAGPPNAPDFSAFEGQYRYLNSFRGGANNPVFDCPDSAAFSTTFKCAVLGCAPEYRDWATAFGGETLHVFGSAVVPSSQYNISHLASSCAGNELSCTAGWAELVVSTDRWGNIDSSPVNGAPSAIDLGLLVDKARDLGGTLMEPRSQLQPAAPNPYGGSIGAQDVAREVDAVKGNAYPFTIESCP